MKRISLFLLLVSISNLSIAQQIRPKSSTEIYQKLKQLNTLGTVMYLAAHPDDENTRLISYLVHHDNIRTVYFSLTRGDGGQNILGTEQGAALGLIRTHELMEARKIDGAEQAFSPVIDFGFTKSPEETFQFWDKEKLVQNVVDAIQKYRPDVLICRFPTTGEGGHGQHTASAIVAGDAYRYIENYNKENKNQLFLPKRLLFNAFKFGSASTIKPGQFQIEINQYDPLLGEGYGEMAGKSRSIHKSQGAGTPQSVGISTENFELLAGEKMSKSLYDGVDLSWNRVGNKSLETKINKVIQAFNFANPSSSIAELIKIKEEVNLVRDDFWRNQKIKEIDELILSCAGIMVEVLAQKPQATLGEKLDLSIHLIGRGNVPIELFNFGKIKLQPDSLYEFPATYTPTNTINHQIRYTQPYWLMEPAKHSTYQYDAAYAGLPEQENDITYYLQFNILGQEFKINAPVSYKYLSPTRGDMIQRLRIVPAVSVAPQGDLIIFDKGKTNTIKVKIKANEDIPEFEVFYSINNNRQTMVDMPAMKEGQEQTAVFEIPYKENRFDQEENSIQVGASVKGKTYDKTQHLIQYEHLPELQYFTGASVKVIEKDWECTAKKIGYIQGVGDYVDDILKLSGLDINTIPENEVYDQGLLKQYDAIVIGIRALNTKPYLATAMKYLLKYAEDGGTLIIQYNTNTGLITNDFAPYPITLSRDRVTEENATVSITDSNSRLLNYPNKITQADFENWVQERGLYFPSKWDKNYKTLLSMHDKNENPLESAILYTDYGKGKFIYTSLAFFRQLPDGNRGAIRLMMNLLSANK